jgi:hypothetical protein
MSSLARKAGDSPEIMEEVRLTEPLVLQFAYESSECSDADAGFEIAQSRPGFNFEKSCISCDCSIIPPKPFG